MAHRLKYVRVYSTLRLAEHGCIFNLSKIKSLGAKDTVAHCFVLRQPPFFKLGTRRGILKCLYVIPKISFGPKV